MLDTPLQILQANVNKSLQATETILDLRIRSADLILIQEPWIIQDQGQSSRSVLHSAYQPMLPQYGNYCPWVIIYAKQSLLNSVELVPQDIQDPDAQGIIVKDKTNKSLQILNVYNEQDSEGTWTLECTLYSTQVQLNCILGGDFNIRHPCWDPNACGISSRAKAFVEWIEEHRFACQNIPNKGTFYRTNMECLSVLDLTFFKGNVLQEEANWHTRDIGSDHQALSFVVHPAAQPIPLPVSRFSFDSPHECLTNKALMSFTFHDIPLLCRVNALSGIHAFPHLLRHSPALSSECLIRHSRPPCILKHLSPRTSS